WNDGPVNGLLARVEVFLRFFLPWMERNCIHDPEYRIKKVHANTLYHNSPEALLFWLQTLAIQVKVRAIMDTLAQIFYVTVSA
ncbi:AcsA protein, partial [Pseudomonas syringae pv. tagetis]